MHRLVESIPSPSGERLQTLEIRRATAFSATQLREAAFMLSTAFDASPLFRAAFPDAQTRSRTVFLMFRAVLQDALRFGRVEMALNSGTIAGMLIWYPPGLYPLSIPRMLRLLPDFLRMVAAAPGGIVKLFRAQMKLNRWRPKKPHCHGYFLGGRAGEQVGSILLKQMFWHADEMGQPIYLETQEPRSMNLYSRFGFERLRDGIETFPGGPLTWTMWREPRLPR